MVIVASYDEIEVFIASFEILWRHFPSSQPTTFPDTPPATSTFDLQFDLWLCTCVYLLAEVSSLFASNGMAKNILPCFAMLTFFCFAWLHHLALQGFALSFALLGPLFCIGFVLFCLSFVMSRCQASLPWARSCRVRMGYNQECIRPDNKQAYWSSFMTYFGCVGALIDDVHKPSLTPIISEVGSNSLSCHSGYFAM